MCVTWAGPETTVTPRPLSVFLWWDQLPQSQVQTLFVLSIHFSPNLSSSAPLLCRLFSLLFTSVFVETLSTTSSFVSSGTTINPIHVDVEYLKNFRVSVSSLFSFLCWLHVCILKPAAFVFTEPCMSFFLFVIIFTLILCRQADVFDGVT